MIRRSLTLVAAFVAMGVLVLAAVAYDGVDATYQLLRTRTVETSDDALTRFECLTEGFREAVPAGTRVLLHTAAPDDETFQRIVESTYPDYDFVSRRADAQLVVHVRPRRTECHPRITIERVS